MDQFLISPSFLAVCLLTQVTEKLLEVENETMMKVADLEKLLLHKDKELQVIRVSLQQLMLLRRASLHLNACVAETAFRCTQQHYCVCKSGHQETGCLLCVKSSDLVLVTPLWWPLRKPTSQPAHRSTPCAKSSRRRTPPSRGTLTLRGGCWSWNSKAPSVCTRSPMETSPSSPASAAAAAMVV